MVHVKLDKAWTDDDGTTHSAGETVDVDAATLAELQEKGIVGDGNEWAGPTASPDAWAGPTAPPKDDEDWAGPTGGTP
jgi:hypothetical protein